MKILLPTTATIALTLSACAGGEAEAPAPLDGAWTLDADASRVNFVSVKAGQVAEAHHFGALSGSVAADGAAEVVIDLASVQTKVDIRDERMREILFETASFPSATISAALDPAGLSGLDIGESTDVTLDLAIDLHGAQAEMPAEMAVTRIGADRVQVETVEPVIVGAAAFGLDTGLEQLRELANLDAITGQVPVSVSLTFERQ